MRPNLAIEVDGEAAGAIGYVAGTDVERYSAEIGYWLGEAYWGRGIATEALVLVTAHVFTSATCCGSLRCHFADNRGVDPGAGKGGIRPRGDPPVEQREIRHAPRPGPVRAGQRPIGRGPT